METELIINSPFGEKLAVTISRANTEKSPLVIMAPGFTSRRKNATNVEMRQRLLLKGISSAFVDLSGHGDSDGNIADQTIVKAAREIEAVVKECCLFDWVDNSRIALLGASFSASAMIIYASQNPNLRGIALKSPITDYIGTRIHQLGNDIVSQWQEKGEITLNDGTKSKYQFYLDAGAVNLYEIIRSLVPPLYIVQGDNDEDVPNAHINRLAGSLNEKDHLEIIRGANHQYNKSDHFNRMIAYLENFLFHIILSK